MVGSVEATGVGVLVGCTTADRDTKKPRRGGRRGKKYAEDPTGPPHIQKKKTAG